jgi:hypothetical protein
MSVLWVWRSRTLTFTCNSTVFAATRPKQFLDRPSIGSSKFNGRGLTFHTSACVCRKELSFPIQKLGRCIPKRMTIRSLMLPGRDTLTLNIKPKFGLIAEKTSPDYIWSLLGKRIGKGRCISKPVLQSPVAPAPSP